MGFSQGLLRLIVMSKVYQGNDDNGNRRVSRFPQQDQSIIHHRAREDQSLLDIHG